MTVLISMLYINCPLNVYNLLSIYLILYFYTNFSLHTFSFKTKTKPVCKSVLLENKMQQSNNTNTTKAGLKCVCVVKNYPLQAAIWRIKTFSGCLHMMLD